MTFITCLRLVLAFCLIWSFCLTEEEKSTIWHCDNKRKYPVECYSDGSLVGTMDTDYCTKITWNWQCYPCKSGIVFNKEKEMLRECQKEFPGEKVDSFVYYAEIYKRRHRGPRCDRYNKEYPCEQ